MSDDNPPATRHESGSHRRRQGRWSRLCLKELRETLRDRRTLVTLFLMPLLVYPLLSMVFQRSLISTVQRPQPTEIVLCVPSETFLQGLDKTLLNADQYLEERQEFEQRPVAEETVGELASDPASLSPPDKPRIKYLIDPQVREQVLRERVDIGIEPGETSESPLRIHYRRGSVLSERGLEYLREHIRAANEQILRAQLRKVGADARLPLAIELRQLPTRSANTILATLVPMILILMTVTGAVYPSIDLTAGERERGTLEMLMAAPVSRLRLLLAKYVAVVTVAFLTALVNLVAMMTTLQIGGLGKTVFGDEGIGFERIGQILALLVLFASFFSAVLLALTSFARSFKEAQAYLIPLMLLSLGPGVISLLPGLELKGPLAITPVSNMVLLARDLCSGGVNPTMAAVAIFSTILYTFAAIGLAAKIFGTDVVLSSGAGWNDLWRERPGAAHGRVSSVGGAFFCLALLFPIYFVVANSASQWTHLQLTSRLVITGAATALLFALFPALVARWQLLDFREAFALHRTSWWSVAIGALWGVTLWPIAHELVVLTYRLQLATLYPEQIELAKLLMKQMREAQPTPWGIVLAMGLAPGICEELFFRGYLGSAMRAAMSPWRAIGVTSVLFGLFHVVSSQALSVERFLPSTFLGLVLGWLCYRTASLWPGVVLHASHNSLLLLMAFYQTELEFRLGWKSQPQDHLPRTWLLGAVISFALGGILLAWLGPKSKFRSEEK